MLINKYRKYYEIQKFLVILVVVIGVSNLNADNTYSNKEANGPLLVAYFYPFNQFWGFQTKVSFDIKLKDNSWLVLGVDHYSNLYVDEAYTKYNDEISMQMNDVSIGYKIFTGHLKSRVYIEFDLHKTYYNYRNKLDGYHEKGDLVQFETVLGVSFGRVRLTKPDVCFDIGIGLLSASREVLMGIGSGDLEDGIYKFRTPIHLKVGFMF